MDKNNFNDIHYSGEANSPTKDLVFKEISDRENYLGKLITKEEKSVFGCKGLTLRSLSRNVKIFSKRIMGKTFPFILDDVQIVSIFTLTKIRVKTADNEEFIRKLRELNFAIEKLTETRKGLVIKTVLPRGWLHVRLIKAELIIDEKGNPRIGIDAKTRNPKFYTALDYTISLEMKDKKNSPLKKQWTPTWLRINVYRNAELIEQIDIRIPLGERALYLLDIETFSKHIEKVAYRVFKNHFPNHEDYREYW